MCLLAWPQVTVYDGYHNQECPMMLQHGYRWCLRMLTLLVCLTCGPHLQGPRASKAGWQDLCGRKHQKGRACQGVKLLLCFCRLRPPQEGSVSGMLPTHQSPAGCCIASCLTQTTAFSTVATVWLPAMTATSAACRDAKSGIHALDS